MEIVEILKAVLFGIVEGITEWLPISSTGHMILLDEFIKLNVSEKFLSMFLVVIQLGAILAVCALFFFGGGFAMGLTSVLQSLMIADAVDYEEYCSGIRPDGVFFSGQTFIAKITAGIATIINGIAYSAVGFSDAKVQEVNDFIAAGGIPRLNPEYEPFMMILFFIVSIPPAIGCILSVIPTWKYALPDKEHKRILAELNEKRHSNAE